MDSTLPMYWLGLLVRLLVMAVVFRLCVWCVFYLVEKLLGITVSVNGWRIMGFETFYVKSQNVELQINGFFVSLRWFDSTCRHFFKINIAGVHLEYYNGNSSKKLTRPAGSKSAPSRRKRLLYWLLKKILKLTELSVKCLEVWTQDKSRAETSSVPILQVVGELSLIAKPLPQGELVLSLEVSKMNGQLLLQLDKSFSLSEDGLYPLIDFKLSAKIVLFLQPLSLNRGLVKSLLLNVVPLSFSVTQQDLLSNILVEYTLPPSLPPSPSTSEPNDLRQRLALLPEKVEVVLENVSCLYQAQGTTRVMSSKVTRVSAALTLSLEEDSTLPSVDGTLAVQNLKVVDSHSRQAVWLQQLRLISTMGSKELTNKLQLDSLHLSLWEEEVVFWSKHALSSFNKMKVKLKSHQQDMNSQHKSTSIVSRLFNVPLSVVTSMESSDWSILLQTNAPTLQAKGPVCRVVMATCAGNIQWESSQEKDTITIKSSLRLADAYIHVPGYHPTVDNPTFFRQREDSPRALPSLHNHLWGRVVSVGALVLKGQQGVRVVEEGAVELCGDGVTVWGEGSSVMLEWSQPTVVAGARVLDYLKTQYSLFGGGSGGAESAGVRDVEDRKKEENWTKRLRQVDLQLTLTDINVFLYALTPEPPSLMIRLDAGSLSTLPCPTLSLHRLLLDDMHLSSFARVFVCSETASLPYGAGVLCVGATQVTFDPEIQDASVNLTNVTGSWTTTAHRCIARATTYLREDLALLRGVVRASGAPSTSSLQPAAGEVVALGDVMKGFLERVPVSVSVRVDKAEGVAHLDKRTSVSVAVTNIQASVTGAVLLASSQEIAVSFDQRRIISLYEFITRFPQEDDKMAAERKKVRFQLERERNPVLWVQASRVDLIFPYEYNFSLAYDKLTNVRKFLQKLHSGAPGKERGRLYLLPDVSAECEDILLQVNDDPFEVKLQTNYELLCDEFDLKTQRRGALDERLNQIRQQQGVTVVSGEKVQSLYNSLEVKDSEIYCQRARKLYSCPEDIRTGLFMFTMEHTKLMAMFDPSLLGEEQLIKNLKEIDAQSPLPAGYSFSTLWGCYLSSSTDRLQMQLRDYPTPLIAITEVTAAGRMVLAEQEARDREQRSAVVEVGHPWSSVTVKRKLPPLKYYYDLEMTSETWDMEYGPCLEPVLAQTNIGFSRLTSPTIDPSRSLPYWDKLRLLFHGPLHLLTNEMRVLLPSTFNPYNSVEYLEIRMCQLDLHLLTNTQLDMEGALQLVVHTASKYDDCCIVDFPRVKSSLKFNWVCAGKGPQCHHDVVRCAPDRVPVLPDNQVHDSYSLFRSQNLDVEYSLDVQPHTATDKSPPSILLYSSTLRCLQQYQALQKWNVTRPTRRGIYFKNLKPRRPPFLRHWRDVKVFVSFPETVLHYWSSVGQQKGVECTLNQGSLAINYFLKLVPTESGLVQRPRANWTIVSCQGKVRNLVAHVKQRLGRRDSDMDVVAPSHGGVDTDTILEFDEEYSQSILLSLEELVYSTQGAESVDDSNEDDNFTHQLEIQNTKLLWNVSNKTVVLGLYDMYNQAQRLKRDLSADALKSINKPPPPELPSDLSPEKEGLASKDTSGCSASARARQASSGNTMLDQLLADISNTFVSYVDERAPSDPLLKGVVAGSMNDVNKRNWIITLTNTQIALQGPENTGYALASSHVAQVFGRQHLPQFKDGDLVSKKSWVAKIQELQYFSTVGTVSELEDPSTIPWLPLSVICPPLALTVNHPEDEQPLTDEEGALNILLGKLGPSEDIEKGLVIGSPPGEAVGGLVRCVLSEGGEGVNKSTVQLQRIASRCHCQVFYVTYGEVVQGEVPSHNPGSPQGVSEYKLSPREAVDTLTVRYPSVDVSTTSFQCSLILDILNNLLLNKEAKKKEATDRKARMQFALQLANIQDPRKHVQAQQNRVRKCSQNLRELQTQLFLETREDHRSQAREDELYCLIDSAKEDLSTASNTLRAMIRAIKQNQLYLTPTKAPNDSVPADPVRRIEIWVDDAHWWLTQDDGQLQVADVCFTNFSYNRMTFSDDSGEHRFELGTFNVHNLMPNTRAIYQHVLHPYDPNAKHLRVDKNISLRVYCKDKAPVAGISVKEHLEVNVVPLSVSLTAKFYQTVQDFFFPKADERVAVDQQDPDHSHLFGPSGVQPTPGFGDPPDRSSPLMSRASSTRYSSISINSSATMATTANHSPPTSPAPKEANTKSSSRHSKPAAKDAVEKMRERASHIKTFIYVKIPQCSLCVNYKGENVSIKDIQNGRFTIPTLEYHNKNWTWADMLMELKKDIKSVIVQQHLKSVVGMKETDETAGLVSPKMTRKGEWSSDMLFGSLQAKVAKSGKKLFSKLGSSKEEPKEETKSPVPRRPSRMAAGNESPLRSSTPNYAPPLSSPDMNAERTNKSTPTRDMS